MSTARLQALEEFSRKRTEKVLEINQRQQRRLEDQLRRLNSQSIETLCSYRRRKGLLEKRYSHLNDIITKTSHEQVVSSSFPSSEYDQNTKSLFGESWLFNHQMRPLRHMAIVRANNVVYLPSDKPKHKGDGHSRMMPTYFHASSLLLQANRKQLQSISLENVKQKPIMKVQLSTLEKLPAIQRFSSREEIVAERERKKRENKDSQLLLPILKYTEETRREPRTLKPRVLRFSLPSLH